MLTGTELTALANGLWAGVALAMYATAVYMLAKHGAELTPEVYRAFQWARLTSLCVAAHRLYWNIGLWLAPEGATYHPWIVGQKHWTLLLVLGICYGTYRTVQPFLRGALAVRYRVLLPAWLAFAAGGSVWLA